MVARKKVKKKKKTIATKKDHGSDSISDNVAAFVNGHIKFDKEQFQKQFDEVQTKMKEKQKESSSSSSSNDNNDGGSNIKVESVMAKVEDHHCNSGLSGLWVWFKNNHIGFIFAMLLQLFTLFAMESTVLSIVFHMNQCGIYEFVTQYIDLKEYDEWLKKNKAKDDDDNQLQWLLELLTSKEFQTKIITNENEKAMRNAKSYKDVVGNRSMDGDKLITITCSLASLDNRFIDHAENLNCLDDKRFLNNQKWLKRDVTFKMGKRLAKAFSCMIGKEIEKEIEEKKFESPLFTFIYQHVMNTIIFLCRHWKTQLRQEDYDDLFVPNAISALRNGVSLSTKINDLHTFEFSLFDAHLPPTTAKILGDDEKSANETFINKLLTMIFDTRVGKNFAKKNSGFQSILQFGLIAKVLQLVAPLAISGRRTEETMAFAKNIKYVLNKNEGLSYFKKRKMVKELVERNGGYESEPRKRTNIHLTL